MQFIPQVLANMRDHPAAKTAIAPLKHVEEGIDVARAFFAQNLPSEIAALKNQTLAALYLRQARVHCRNGETAQARALVRQAWGFCPSPSILRKSAVVLIHEPSGRTRDCATPQIQARAAEVFHAAAARTHTTGITGRLNRKSA